MVRARLAGIPEWKHVINYSPRKAFESVLRAQTIEGGRLDKGTQEFLFGYILPGSQDTYYDKSKIEFHREEYQMLDFRETVSVSRSKDKLMLVGELESYFSDGWFFVSKIDESMVVVIK